MAAHDWFFAHVPLPGSLASSGRKTMPRRVVRRLGALREGVVELRGSTYEHWWIPRLENAVGARKLLDAGEARVENHLRLGSAGHLILTLGKDSVSDGVG